MSTKKGNSSYSAPALSRGLEILAFLADRPGAVSQTEISRSLGRTSGEQFRILSVLEREGFLRRDEAGRYHLTLRLLRLGLSIDPAQTLLGAARGPMRAFARTTGEECHLTTIEDGRLVVLAQEPGTGPISLRIREGSVHDPRKTTSGRLLLAGLDPDERSWQLTRAGEEFPGPRPPEADPPGKGTGTARRGWIRAENEFHPGIVDFAVEVPGTRGVLPAVLTTSRLASTKASWKPGEEALRRAAAGIDPLRGGRQAGG